MKKRFARAVLATVLVGGALATSPAEATCTTEPMMGSICITAAPFCPRNYIEPNGQLLAISTNQALFSLLGTQYGGNGTTNFALPDLRGRLPRGVGTGAQGVSISEGEVGGRESVSLLSTQMPPHSHVAQMQAASARADSHHPGGALFATTAEPAYTTGPSTTATSVTGIAGSSQPVNVLNPYVGLRYCIALQGIFPSRN